MRSLLEHLLRRHGEIISNSTVAVQETTGSIRGPGLWPQTQLRRQVTANPALVIYRDIQRTFEVGPNRVLKFVINNALVSLEPFAGRSDLVQTPYGMAIGNASSLAARARRVIQLRDMYSPTSSHSNSAMEPSALDVKQASRSSRRVYTLAARLYLLYQDISQGEHEIISRCPFANVSCTSLRLAEV